MTKHTTRPWGARFVFRHAREEAPAAPLPDEVWSPIAATLGDAAGAMRSEIERCISAYGKAKAIWDNVRPRERVRDANLLTVAEQVADLIDTIHELNSDARAMLEARVEEDGVDLATHVAALSGLKGSADRAVRWAKAARMAPASNRAKPAEEGLAIALLEVWASYKGKPKRITRMNKVEGDCVGYLVAAMKIAGAPVGPDGAGAHIQNHASAIMERREVVV